MACFPFFVELSGAQGLVVGGGAVALRKIQRLLPFGPWLTVTAPALLPEIRAIPGLRLCQRPFEEEDLHSGLAFVVAATDDRAENHKIAALCRERCIPVNVVDDSEECSFLFPALVQRGKLTVGISTAGASPTAASWLKEQIAALLPASLEAILDYLDSLRPEIQARIGEEKRRTAVFRELFFTCLAQGRPLTGTELEQLLAKQEAAPQKGTVALVGAGCGKADLLTLRGRARLGACDAVVYDDLIDPALLDMAPERALRLYMGKRKDMPCASQEEINAALIRLARQGLQVVRLKGGDPFVFGRGGEEALALQEAGIPFEVVPGISSAIAIPAEAGIPVTHRGLSREVHIIAAHTAGEPVDFAAYAGLSGTLVFLMGLSLLEQIAAQLILGGKSPDTPAAVLSGGNAPQQQAVRGTLADIAGKASGLRAPAVIVVGDVAALTLL